MYIHLSIESLKWRIKDRMVENNKFQLSFNDNQAMEEALEWWLSVPGKSTGKSQLGHVIDKEPWQLEMVEGERVRGN